MSAAPEPAGAAVAADAAVSALGPALRGSVAAGHAGSAVCIPCTAGAAGQLQGGGAAADADASGLLPAGCQAAPVEGAAPTPAADDVGGAADEAAAAVPMPAERGPPCSHGENSSCPDVDLQRVPHCFACALSHMQVVAWGSAETKPDKLRERCSKTVSAGTWRAYSHMPWSGHSPQEGHRLEQNTCINGTDRASFHM